MISDYLKNIFDSLGFAYEFAFCQNNGSLKIFQSVFWNKSFKNAEKYQHVFGGIPKQISKYVRVRWVRIGEMFEFSRKLRYGRIIFIDDGSIFFLYVLKYFDDEKEGVKVHDPGTVKIFELPEILRKILQ